MPTVLVIFLALPFLLRPAAGTLPHKPTDINAQAQETAVAVLRTARSLRCLFDSGSTMLLNRAPPKEKPSSGIAEPVLLERIDRTARRARIVVQPPKPVVFGAEAITAEATLIVADTVLTFILENSASISVYTVLGVYRPGTRARELLAIGSLHNAAPLPMGVFFRGYCRPEL